MRVVIQVPHWWMISSSVPHRIANRCSPGQRCVAEVAWWVARSEHWFRAGEYEHRAGTMGRPTQETARFPAAGTLQHAQPRPVPILAAPNGVTRQPGVGNVETSTYSSMEVINPASSTRSTTHAARFTA